MCLAVPIKVKRVFSGQVELIDGRRVGTVLIKKTIKPGDWVVVQDNFVLYSVDQPVNGNAI